MKRYMITGRCEDGTVWLHWVLSPRVIGNGVDGFYDQGKPTESWSWCESSKDARQFYSWKVAEDLRDRLETRLRQQGWDRNVFKLKVMDIEDFAPQPIVRRRLSVRNKTIGPEHDPYSREFNTVQINDHEITLVSCGLAGIWVEIDGDRITERPPRFTDRELEKEYEDEVRATFEHIAGMSVSLFRKSFERNYMPDPMGNPSMYE